MDKYDEIYIWHNIMLPIMKQEKEEARIHLAEIKRTITDGKSGIVLKNS